MQINKNRYGRSVVEYGAKGDGKSDDSPAFQAALDSGCPLITIPFGHYIIGSPLKAGSNTTIHAHRRAEIKLGDHVCTKRGDFLLTNCNHSSGDKNITIHGGIWNGNNSANPKSDLFDANGYSGALMNFFNVENLVLSDLTLFNPSAYFTRFCKINHFLFEDIIFAATLPCPNNDGIHLGGFCQNGIIRNLHASTPNTPNDDMIALNADDCITRVENLDMKCGLLQNIIIDGLHTDSCHSFVRILSIDSEIRNISIHNLKGGFSAMAINMDGARYCRTPLIGVNDPRYTNGAGCVENIHISDMNVYATEKNANRAFICLESNMKNFMIDRFIRNAENDAYDSGVSVRIRNIGSSEIITEGLTTEQAGLLSSNEIAVKQSSPYKKDIYRIIIKKETGDIFTLPTGSFSRLYVNNIEN